jgi:hypothetical protein
MPQPTPCLPLPPCCHQPPASAEELERHLESAQSRQAAREGSDVEHEVDNAPLIIAVRGFGAVLLPVLPFH